MNKIKIKARAELGIVLGVIVGNWDVDNVERGHSPRSLELIIKC